MRGGGVRGEVRGEVSGEVRGDVRDGGRGDGGHDHLDAAVAQHAPLRGAAELPRLAVDAPVRGGAGGGEAGEVRVGVRVAGGGWMVEE